MNGDWLFKNADKEMLRRLIWLLVEFCGLELLTYAIMSNHFHVLVRVFMASPISDEELLGRYRLLQPANTARNEMRFDFLRAQLAANTTYAVEN